MKIKITELSTYLKLIKSVALTIAFLFVIYSKSFAQTVRYQNSLRGGLTVATNGLLLDDSPVTYVNTSGGTTMSSYSDLVLPSGSSIVKAILYTEGYSTAINSIKFKMAGSGTYTTLTNASAGFIGNPSTGSYSQFIIDVTNMIPATGFVSTVTSGGNAANTGRYAVADLSPVDANNHGYGWALFVVYTNAASKYRNVTIVDANKNFGSGTTTTFTVSNITVPSSGTVNAIVAVTGCWGDAGSLFTDNVKFGKSGTTLTSLVDPATAQNTDIMNSTIGFSVPNNITIDGVVGMTNGNYVARNPFSGFTVTGTSTGNSLFYDCDVMNASGILAPSATPINVAFSQMGSSFDALGSGAYGISIDLAPSILTKSISPQSICDGGTAVYTFTIANTETNSINLTNIGFTDNLPPGIIVASPSGATISGGSGGVLTAAAGSGSISLSGFSLPGGQTATITVNVTNVPGQLNPSCGSNPTAFTNGFSNITGNTANLANAVTPQCLIVYPIPTVTVTNTTTCSGNTVTLNASGATSYTWSNGENSSSVSVSPTITTIYTVTGSTNGCSNTNTVSVTVSPTPTTTATTTGTLTCSTPIVVLNSTLAGVNYTWTAPAGGSVGSANTQSTSVMGIPGTYTLNVSTAAGCTYSTTTVVTQNTVAPIVTGSTSGTLSCTTLTVNASATTTTTPVSYNWSGTSIVSGTGTGTIGVTQPGTFNYTVTNTNNGCQTTGSLVVTQNTVAPTVTVTPATQTITCAAPTVTLTGSATPSTCTPVWTGGVSSGVNSYTATASSANIYTLTVTNPINGCIKSTTTQVVPSAGIPVVTASVTNSLTCTNLTALVVATTTSSPVSYNWNGPGVIGGATTASATVNAGGQYTVVVTNTASACSTTITISVSQSTTAPTVAGATTGTLTCSTLTVNANATTTTSPVSYNWSGTGITSATNISTITVNQAGTFNYTVTNTSNGCTTTGFQSVVQNTTTPIVTAASSGTLTCTTLTVNASATTTTSPVSYNWSGTGIISATNISTITVNQPGTFNYTVTNTSNGCTTTGSQVVTQNTMAPVVTSATSGTLTCTTLTVNASATTTTTPVSYNWIGTGIISASNIGTITVNQPGSVDYTVTNTSNGCITTNSQVVTQNTVSPIGLSAGSNQTMTCASASVTLNGSVSSPTNTTANWSGTNICGTVSNYTTQVCAAGVYTLQATNPSNGCIATSTVEVFANPGAPTTTISASSVTVDCNNPIQTVTVTSTPVTDVVFNWSPIPASGVNSAVATFTNQGTYVCTVTNTITSCATSTQVVVTTNTTVPVINISGTQTLTCSNPSAVISTTVNPALTYTWTGTLVSGQGTGTVVVNQPGDYSVTVTGANGCINTASSHIDADTNIPIASISVSSTNSVITCLASSVTLSVSATPAGTYSYNWSGVSTSAIQNATTTGVYTATVLNATSGCTATAQFTVTSNTTPPALSVTDYTIPCSSNSVTIVANASNVTYTWTTSGGSILSGANTASPVAGSIGQYVVTVTDNTNGCINSGTVTVAQNTITTAISASPISGTAPLSVDFTNTSIGGSNYSWNFDDANNNTSNASAPNHIYNTNGVYTVTFTVTDASGLCSATATISIEVFENAVLIVPNVFTPNGDNSNDVFKITSTGISTLNCDIFNRWGQKMYTITSLGESWDGKVGGTDVPAGTYFYILKATGDDGKEYNQQNYINLFR